MRSHDGSIGTNVPFSTRVFVAFTIISCCTANKLCYVLCTGDVGAGKGYTIIRNFDSFEHNM